MSKTILTNQTPFAGRQLMLTALLLLVIPLTGCASPLSDSSQATVRLSKEGRIFVGDTYTGLRKMVKQLKADGVSKRTKITIEIPDNTSPKAMKSIAKTLSKGGYKRILFIKPRKVSAETGLDPILRRIQENKTNN